MSKWAEAYDKAHRPVIKDLQAFMKPDVYALLARYNASLAERYMFSYVKLTFSRDKGWCYNYGNSGCILITGLTIEEDAFTVCGVRVDSPLSLAEALEETNRLYEDGYRERLRIFKEKRSARRSAKSAETEKNGADERAYINACRWPEKVSRADIRRLYQLDAAGRPDDELADKIGFAMYFRCITAREIWELMTVGKIKCFYCGEVLKGIHDQYFELVCKCGRRYTYHAYRKSYREDNMPRGAASDIFDQYISDWGNAREYKDKMRLIDGLIHSFHVSIISGEQGRPVGVNLISGTKAQIAALITELAR